MAEPGRLAVAHQQLPDSNRELAAFFCPARCTLCPPHAFLLGQYEPAPQPVDVDQSFLKTHVI
jgi:hypothetical protein